MPKQTIFILIVCLSLLNVRTQCLCADEFSYPAPAYSTEELTQVRAWEQQWVDKKISAENVDSVREFLPDSLYRLMSDVATWGTSWFTVAPYRQILPTPGEVELTRRFWGRPKLGSRDELIDWIAGIPFPKPANGLHIAHNFKRRNNGDGIENRNSGAIIDGRMKYTMESQSLNRYCFWAGRYDTPPVPEFPGNHDQVWRTGLVVHEAPPENRNLKTLEIQYKDEMRPYDAWVWQPATRRVQRRTATAREDATGGADYCEYDSMGYDGPIQANTYALLGSKEFLWARHTDTARLENVPGACLWSGAHRERLKTYVLEVTSKDPAFIYPRQIWYIDPETWQILYAERFDRSGKLWRILDQFFFVGRGYNNAALGQYTAIQSIDIQNVHATILKSDMRFGVEFDMHMFTREYLQKNGY